MNLDDDLTIQESRWRGRLITLAVLVAIGALIAAGAYQFFFRDEDDELRATEDYTVGRATINANLIVSGVAEAQLISDLSFRLSGRVEEVNVSVGDVIRRGDVLAAMEQALQYETYDADYVEAIVHQQRRQRELPSPTEVLPERAEWIEETDYESPDPASYDHLLENDEPLED